MARLHRRPTTIRLRPARHQGPPRQGRDLELGVKAGCDCSSTAEGDPSTPTEEASSARRSSTRSRLQSRSMTTRSSVGSVGRARPDRGRGPKLSTAPTARNRDLHQRRRRRPRVSNEVEVGMVGINVPIPVPMAFFSFGGWKACCSATATHTAWRCPLLHPREGRHVPLARPEPRRHQWASPELPIASRRPSLAGRHRAAIGLAAARRKRFQVVKWSGAGRSGHLGLRDARCAGNPTGRAARHQRRQGAGRGARPRHGRCSSPRPRSTDRTTSRSAVADVVVVTAGAKQKPGQTHGPRRRTVDLMKVLPAVQAVAPTPSYVFS